MPFIQTKIKDVVVFEPRIFTDDRGYFFETYNEKLFNDNGIAAKFVQDNQSKSSYGVIRGLHFQKGEHAQAKLVRVLQGSVLDVAVDLRAGSETYGKHVAVELSDVNNLQLFIPRGFAHGFSVLSRTAVFAYKCDNLYCKESEGGIDCNDPDLGIDWQIPAEDRVLSEKDKLHPLFKDFKTCF